VAGKRTEPSDAAAQTGEEPVSTVGDTGPDADLAADQMASEEKAEAKREREAERAESLKSVPEGAAAPNEKLLRSGETVFRQQWLIDNAWNVLNIPPFEVAGAFHGVEQEYLSVKDAERLVDDYRTRVVNVDPSEEVA
jgi:hypothetical protein